jgi:hypothetical protein
VLPSAVEIGIVDVAQRLAVGHPDAVRALIHDQRLIQEIGPEPVAWQDVVMPADRLVVGRMADIPRVTIIFYSLNINIA